MEPTLRGVTVGQGDRLLLLVGTGGNLQFLRLLLQSLDGAQWRLGADRRSSVGLGIRGGDVVDVNSPGFGVFNRNLVLSAKQAIPRNVALYSPDFRGADPSR